MYLRFKCVPYYIERRLCESIDNTNDMYFKAYMNISHEFKTYGYTFYVNLKGAKKVKAERPIYTLSVMVNEEILCVHLIKLCYDSNEVLTVINHLFRVTNEYKDQKLYEEVTDAIIREVFK